MMMAEKIRNVLLKIIGFVAGTIATIVALYLLGTTALLIIITGGCITLAINRRHKRLTNEIEYLKKEINKLKEKK
ncbi:MAG: hypothetical protein OXU23_15770 [Candidatus Poribacteria bacterium]|nr:hypothetical protein [Candidatus Poribacteria bacterium]